MQITKERFLMMVAAMIAVAGFLAWQVQGIAAEDTGTADTIYLVITIIIIAFLIRIEAFNAALAVIYGSSLLFCFFYIFVAPFEAPIIMFLFFWPALLWQKRKIEFWQLSLIGAALIALSWKTLGRPAILILLAPTCQILAIRLTGSVNTRFSHEEANMSLSLSYKQKQAMKDRNSSNSDWWEIIRPEIEAFPLRLQEVWQDFTGNSPRRQMTGTGLADMKLLQLQNAAKMSQALTSIKKRDQHFAPDSFIKRIEKIFWKVQNAWYDQKIDTVQHLVSDALFEQFKRQIDEQKESGIRFKHSNMTIYEARIAQVNCDNSFDVIHIFIRASSADSMFDLTTGETLARNEENRRFSEYWTFIRRPSAKTLQKPGLLEGVCPNCGTPIEIGQATVCGSCGSFIRSGFYDWVLAHITQACEWEYNEPSLISDWNVMKNSDPDFNIQQIEDRSGVIFWMLRLAERQRSVDPVRRFATEAYCDFYQSLQNETSGIGSSFMESVALGSIMLKGFKFNPHWNKLYVLVVWSGVPVTRNVAGKVVEGRRVSKVVREVLILGRRSGVKTGVQNTLSSAHCPNCGGPLVSAFAITCNYCNTILNEGSNSWILERVVAESDPEYQNMLASRKTEKVEVEDDSVRSARDVITIMAHLLLADGKTEVQELDLLEKIAETYGMTESDLNSIIWGLKQGEVYIPAPADNKEAWNLLLSATRMALADDVLTPTEERELEILAQHLGYCKADVVRAIKAEKIRKFTADQEALRRANLEKLNAEMKHIKETEDFNAPKDSDE
ncbi:MAG: TIM44-like domain-containing protein [Candidatus Riflebacteria bacterium]|nr:TIM44-like domain-containing protein [Candidatus Riflebacteria bacterium]